MMKVLVLCHGNKYRSPTCEAVLKSLGGMEVESAGFVNPGNRAAKCMRDALGELGYNLEEHKSRVVTLDMLENADIILYMDTGNYKRLKGMCTGNHLSKARCLAHYIGFKRIADPAFVPKDSPSFKVIINSIIRASKKFHDTQLKGGKIQHGKES